MNTDVAADAYAEADFREVNREFVADAAAFLGSPGSVLDLGCGPGDIPIALEHALDCPMLAAVDAAGEMLQWARSRVISGDSGSSVSLVQADAKRLPFRDAAFGAVVSNSILHHVSEPAAFWAEVSRVAANGGRIFMRDLSRPDSIADAQGLVDAYARDESEALQGEFYRSLCAAYTVDEVRAQLEEAGLTRLLVRESSDRHLDIRGVIR